MNEKTLSLLQEAASFGYHAKVDELNGIPSRGYFGRFLQKYSDQVEKSIPKDYLDRMVALGYKGPQCSVDDAHKWVRDKYKMYPCINSRHMEDYKIGFSVYWAKPSMNMPWSNLSDFSDHEEDDGVISYDYDETLYVALDQVLNYLASDLYKYHSSPYLETMGWDEYQDKFLNK